MDRWQDLAACQIQLPVLDLLTDDEYEAAYNAAVTDISFISKPDEVTERRWAKTCSRCPVPGECYAWAERNDVSGVFVAGEWRE